MNELKPIGRYGVIIGIDPGTTTGIASWDNTNRKLLEVKSMLIHDAMNKCLSYQKIYKDSLFIRFEDARLRNFFGKKGREHLMGAGSIKRDCTIWDDFLKAHDFHYASLAPKLGLTKLSREIFAQVTGWKEMTNEHSRDAAMLVYGY